MYLPPAFRQDDLAAQYAVIEAHPLAVLVFEVAGRAEVAHLPFVLDRARGPKGTIAAHLARANPMSDAIAAGGEALVVFQGPHAYISADWYGSENQVPTWNYVAVHARGRPRVLDDAAAARLLADLSAAGEATLPKAPWTTAAIDATTLARMSEAVLCFEIEIAVIEGKWKMGQNKEAAERRGAAAALRDLGGAANLAVAELMEAPDR